MAADKAEKLRENLADGKNDSAGIKWLPIDQISIENSSPILLKIAEIAAKSKDLLKANIYKDWTDKRVY